jgi:hypothetical protein
MSRQEVYDAWREKSRQVDITESFADQVMNHVYQYQQDRSRQFFKFRWLIDLILEHPLAQAAFVVIGAITGLIRIAFVVCVFLGT